MKNLYILALFLSSLLTANAQSLSPIDYVPGYINVIETNESTGQIMIGGSFNESAGFPFAKFAIMENDEFINPQSGFPEDESGGIKDFAVSHGISYAGGVSDDPMWKLAKKDNINDPWESSGINIDGGVTVLDTLSDGNLVVLGDFTSPYPGAFVYDGENVSPLPGFSVNGTPTDMVYFAGKYYIGYFSLPQDYKNLFIWDESCGCESAESTNLPTNFIVYAIARSEDKLYIALWNFDGGDKEFYESTDGVVFNVIGNMNGEPVGIKSHDGLVYFYGDLDEVNGVEVNPIVTYDPNTLEWKSVDGTSIAGTGAGKDIGFIGDDLYAAIGSWMFVYKVETPVDTTEDTTNISIFEIEKHINIYPNPAKDIVTIEIDNIENIFDEVSIFNSYGQLVSFNNKLVNDSKIIINIENLPAGIYSVKSEHFQGRFVKF